MDFEERYKDLNSNILTENWHLISGELKGLLERQYKSEAFYTEWSEDVNDFLILLKLFPLKKAGRNVLAPKTTFYNSVKKLINFYEVR